MSPRYRTLPKHKKKHLDLFEEEEVKHELAQLWDHVKEYPAYYIIGAVVIAGAVFAGFAYKANAKTASAKEATALAEALEPEETPEKLAKLDAAVEDSAAEMPDAWYLRGEMAFEGRDFEKAKTSFEHVRENWPNAPVTPDAVEGIGFVLEAQNEDYEGAKAKYEEVITTWPESYAAIRQPFNIARCEEQLGNLKAATERYQEQVEMFPESALADKAQSALDRLTSNHPELRAETAEAPEAAAETAAPAPDEQAVTFEEEPAAEAEGSEIGESAPEAALQLDVTGQQDGNELDQATEGNTP